MWADQGDANDHHQQAPREGVRGLEGLDVCGVKEKMKTHDQERGKGPDQQQQPTHKQKVFGL